MMRIRQLPPSVITKIAAGEVIERPSSVVKELLENAVDAGSSRVDVDVEQGGIELIRVVDNGRGIFADDLPLAFASHATSKLTSADDLFQVQTLGFRGEALASIGGISQVALQSRPADQGQGAEITCHGGDLSAVRAWNGAVGTRLEVRHLFFNTPVRRKFLRTPGTEMGHICEVFTRLALARPELHLTLRHNGKDVYQLPASDRLQERIALFFGTEVGDRLYAVEARHGPVHLHGFVADPACSRGNAKMQYLFLNGRWIRDRSLGYALQEAYRGLLLTGRYAVSFLFLDMPPELVDVNVHPTKAEVRFRDAQTLFTFLHSTVRQRLTDENLTPRLQPTSTLANPQQPGAQVLPWLRPRYVEETAPLFAQGGLPAFTKVASPPAPPVPANGNPASESCLPPPPGGAPSPAQAAREAATQLPSSLPDQAKAIQLYNAYLVLETPEGMLVIDQHALHERILFEYLQERLRSGTLEVQKLLIPEPVELTAEQAARVLEQRQSLAELGLEVEDFGGGTLLVASYPALLHKRSPGQILKTIVDFLCAQDRPPTRLQLLNDLLSVMACHAAVRAGDPLTPEEIASLAAQRDLAADHHHCPHGRPTSLLFTRQDLDRQFRRI